MSETDYISAAFDLLSASNPPEKVIPPNSVHKGTKYVLPRYEFHEGPGVSINADLEGNSDTNVMFQIDVVVGSGLYSSKAHEMRDRIINLFRAGRRLAGSTITERPSYANPFSDGSEYRIPITISLRASIALPEGE